MRIDMVLMEAGRGVKTHIPSGEGAPGSAPLVNMRIFKYDNQ